MGESALIRQARAWVQDLHERRRAPGAALRVGIGLVVLALGVRLVVAYGFHFLDWKTPDTLKYLDQARVLLEGGYSDFFPNGYPALVALIWTVPGLEHQRWPLHAVNVLVSTGTVALTYWLAWTWKRDWWIAIAAGVLIATWPNHLRFVRRLLSDLPATIALVMAVSLLLSRRFTLAGALFGFGAILRPTLIPIAIIAIGWGLLREKEARTLLACIGAAIPVVAMLTFGYAHTGEVRLGSNLAYNLVKSVAAYHPDWQSQMADANLNTTEALQLYLTTAARYPTEFLTSRLVGFWEMWGPWALDSNRSILSRIVLGLRIPALLLGGYGLWTVRDDQRAWLVAWPVIGLTLLHMTFFGRPRFTLPTEPFLCVLIGVAVVSLLPSPTSGPDEPADDATTDLS